MKYIFLLLNLAFLNIAVAQIDIDTIPRVDSMWQDYIHTVQIYNASDEQSLPIIQKNRGTIKVHFDDSYGEFIDYFYTIKHCDKNWNYTPDIEVSEYLEGPEELEIESFANSVLTQKNYTHYEFSFPNRDIKLRWSGNYLLIIYDAEGTVAITRRFYVYEKKVDVIIDKVNPNGPEELYTHQAFLPKIDITNLDARNAVDELFLTGFQNRFNEETKPLVSPFIVDSKYARFNFTDQFSFLGLKEYRFFDTRSLLNAGFNVNKIDLSNTHSIVLLYLDKNRSDKGNFDRNEANGAYIIRNEDRRQMSYNITAEYPEVIFTLQARRPIRGEVYLMGEFNDFKINPAFRMEYLPEHKAYNLEVPLKQGYYNYLYAVKREGEPLDYYPAEGSSFETENMYHFFCYYRPFATEYDQLISYSTFQTNGF